MHHQVQKNPKGFRIILTNQVKPEDQAWKFLAKIPNLPQNEKTDSGEKIWLKFLTVTQDSIQLSIDKTPTNRILSGDNNEKFIHVSFEKFRFKDLPPKMSTEYISRLLKTGIELNGVKYIFYGHSNSQLRSRSCYMYAAHTEDLILRKINGFGDFSKFNSVAKRAKRIGLLFSAAESSIQLKPEHTKDIEDVESEGYLFTDGCGTLSSTFATELAKQRKIIFQNQRYVPSAFQIRYKGYKGMLMVDLNLKDKKACFRDSMKKFKDCPNDTFSILDYSKPFTFAFLNGELVTLLASLGIKDDVFLQKQNEYFEFLKEASAKPFTAFQYLCYKSEPELAEKILLDGITQTMKGKIRKLVKEEWTGTFKKNEVKDDSERVRILIHQSRILFGVCDYTETLKEGQCHVRITVETGGFRTLNGADVIVSRNPCLHPGDIRKFKAVECKELNHLNDCIVFPIVGKRDAASLMSGGDLDGDKFFVSWDRDIIPSIMFEAYGYPPAKEAPRREITYGDMIDYFARYNNASLGRVKNLYLEWVKVSKEGAGSKECQELNKLFSSNVDGERIKVPEHLEAPPKPNEGSKPFILDSLCNNIKNIAKTFFEKEASSEIETTTSEDLLHELLSSCELCLFDEFELFQITLRWCRNNLGDIRDFLCYFDFGAFSTTQKHAVFFSLIEMDPGLREQYIGPIYNGLYQSELLRPHELSSCNLNCPQIRWQKFYSSFDDDGRRLYSCMEKAMEDFDKKIIVLHVDEQLKVAIYIPKRVEKGKDLDVGGERGTTRPKQNVKVDQNTRKKHVRYFPTVKLFAFDPLSGHFYKKTTVLGYQLSYDGEIIQLYEKHRRNTFIWFGLNEKWSIRNGIVRQQEDKGDFKVSIALQIFDYLLAQSHDRVTKVLSSGIEIFVISNRDRVGHNILDITMNQVDTTEVKKILQNIPKDYEITFETADWQFREFCIPIVVDGKLEELSKIQDSSQLEHILFCCIGLKNERRLFEIFEALLKDPRLAEMLNSNKLKYFVENAPSLSCLIIPALADKIISISDDESKTFIFTLIKALLVSCNDLKEITLDLFKNLLSWMHSNGISLSITELTDLVKRILFTIRHAYLAEVFIKDVFNEEIPIFGAVDPSQPSSTKEYEYGKHFILALAMDYLGEIREICPCDFRGIPKGAEEYGQGDPEPTTGSYRSRAAGPSRLLADFIPEKYTEDNADPDRAEIQTKSKKLEPHQICLEITHSPHTFGLYQTILRTDIMCKIRNEDHIRFCASKRAIGQPKRKIAVFDAIVHGVRQGKMEFWILQPEPVELTSASWNVYICGSTTNFTTQLVAIKTLLERKTFATIGYQDILEIPESTPNNRSKSQTDILLPQGKFNTSQAKAITEALYNPVTLIWGPPGCGKTTVVVEIIIQFLKLHPGLRLLVTASTHNAVDNVMERFLKDREKLFGNAKSDDTIRLTSEVSKVSSGLKKWTLDAFVGKDLHSNDKAKGEAAKKLKEAKIVFSTCSGAGVGLLRCADHQKSPLTVVGIVDIDEDEGGSSNKKKTKKKLKSEERFDVVIVDEASQITEPNALIPIVKSSKYVILVGDHVQLCPTVTQTAKEYGLETSLFEKLYRSANNSARKIMLDTQYRMHPQLADFPSKIFYDGKLKSGIKKEDRLLPQSKFTWPKVKMPDGSEEIFPCAFINCTSQESYGDSSKVNKGQVNMTLKVVQLLRTPVDPNSVESKKLTIAVLTPYSKQKEQTIQAFKSKSLASGIEVNTIDGFQGREADIIIFSTVRANRHHNLGFLDDDRRINVAITRAKYGLVIIGDKETLDGGKTSKRMVSSCKMVELNDT